ncbi:flagellar basal body-associated FliL family protein [Haloimpatiens sp. FM7315]|uniref:flagellar basal body-associated FliL family protein n=1 Tax=Haloimpatiens sp. FM7315 TaxID=3298609 RepID=UPI0035A3B56F
MKEKQTEKKGKSKKIIIILLVIVLAGGCGFGGYYFATRKASDSGVKSAVNMQGNVEKTTYELGEFLINLADQDEKRYFKANIYLGFPKKDKKLAKELEENKSIIRDTINLSLISKKAAELENIKGLDAFKKDILTKINSKLTEGQVMDIYFDSIIVQ